jgi:hypothetical protein
MYITIKDEVANELLQKCRIPDHQSVAIHFGRLNFETKIEEAHVRSAVVAPHVLCAFFTISGILLESSPAQDANDMVTATVKGANGLCVEGKKAKSNTMRKSSVHAGERLRMKGY